MVAPGYFRTLRIPVLRGREFTDADNANPMAGFVVNEAFARSYLSARDPLDDVHSPFGCRTRIRTCRSSASSAT